MLVVSLSLGVGLLFVFLGMVVCEFGELECYIWGVLGIVLIVILLLFMGDDV